VVAFRPANVDVDGFCRSYFAIFANSLLGGLRGLERLPAIGRIAPANVPFADFEQASAGDFELFIHCSAAMGSLGLPPPPHFGVIVEVNCLKITEFKDAALSRAVPRMLCEEVPMI
jgi:hypothetical protein